MDDGPGIRATVFFKGCNLDCAWCHNPETKSPAPQKRTANGRETAFGREISPDALFDEIKRDIPFYVRSGGGVTFSGGEPLLQPDFLFACLNLCKKGGVHTAVDTAGNVAFELFKKISSCTDLILYDIKHIDDGIHSRYTGASNARIIENLKKLAGFQVEVVVRVIVLPDINDDEDYFRRFADFMGGFPHVKRVDVLPYHAMGLGKYKQIGEICRFNVKTPPDEAKVEIFRNILKEAGL